MIVLSEKAAKLDKSYYDFVKATISKITGLPKGAFDEVSSRDREEWGFKPNSVTLIINPWNNKKARQSQVEKFEATIDDVKKAFNNKCEIIEVSDFNTYSIVVPQEVIDSLNSGKDNTSSESEKDIISFWATTVYDTHTTAVAYGAKIKCADGWNFPDSIKRIQQRLGERRFYYYSAGPSKSFKTYAQLVKALKEIDSYIEVPSEQEIIDAGYDERYFTH